MISDIEHARRNKKIAEAIKQADQDRVAFCRTFANADRIKIIAAVTMLRYVKEAYDVRPMSLDGNRLPEHRETIEEAQSRVATEGLMPAVHFWKANCHQVTDPSFVVKAAHDRYVSVCLKKEQEPIRPENFPQTYAELWEHIPALRAA